MATESPFYYGPAWVIKPRLFPLKEKQIEKPGPNHYHIPDRSIYTRLGKTIGNRYETIPLETTRLLAHYYPNDQYISNVHIPAISITPRRIKPTGDRGYSERLYLPTDQTLHHRTPLLKPRYGPTISRKRLDPGPATYYPMFEFHKDSLPRRQPGITQKHRFSSDQKTNPPFYYPNKPDHHRLPSFTIGRRLLTSRKINQYTIPYYSSLDNKTLCSNVIKPGVTLKGRWSPSIYIPTRKSQNIL